MADPTLMLQEASETPQKIQQQINHSSVYKNIAQAIKSFAPKFVMIVGRGSSDHAGVFAKYLIEIELGIPTFAAAPSIASVYNRTLNLSDGLVIVISQSGRSPDILAQAKSAKASGALCLALVNDETSPLSDIVDFVIPLKAGEEKSVAATKSFLCTLSSLLLLVGYWSENQKLITQLRQLPDILTKAIESPTQIQPDTLTGVKNLVVSGRGLGYAISKEMALKLKEVCGIHAEAFSSAEFLHGPVTLVSDHLTMINVAVQDESFSIHSEQIEEFKQRGATLIDLVQVGQNIPERLAPLELLLRFYIDIEAVARRLNRNPDEPVGLKKITQTH